MKTYFKKLSAILLSLFVVLTLSGCNDYDASAYINACLDANTHGEFDNYAQMTHTDAETISRQYNNMIDGELAYLESFHANEAQKEKFRELFIQIYKAFKYEVGEATKNDDGSYNVPVTTYKLMILKNVIKDGDSYITNYIATQGDAGKTLTDEEIYSAIIDFMYEEISKNYEAREYGDPVVINVTVGPLNSSSNTYGISEKDLHALLQNFIDIENAS